MRNKLAELFSKECPIILLHEGEELNNEIIENTKLDPNSPEAWYEEDKTGAESDLVRIGNFTWQRQKSNDNVSDTGEGKGISFFYARYAYLDEKKRIVPCRNGNNRVIGKISKDDYSVIDTEDDRNFTRIISARNITDPHSQWIRFYYRGGEKATESIIRTGEPAYPGADDTLSEIYDYEANTETQIIGTLKDIAEKFHKVATRFL
jgi:uncharacterized DUF497 family protein